MTVALLIIFVFALIGIADTIYLIYHVITKKPVACLFFPKEWCLKVQYSKYSKTFGIPKPAKYFLGRFQLVIYHPKWYAIGYSYEKKCNINFYWSAVFNGFY